MQPTDAMGVILLTKIVSGRRTTRTRNPGHYSNRTNWLVAQEFRCLFFENSADWLLFAGAHSHIRGLGLDDALEARMVSQVRAMNRIIVLGLQLTCTA